MSDQSKITALTNSELDQAVKPGDILAIHHSEPASRWQEWKQRYRWRRWLRWYIRLFPIQYQRCYEEFEVTDITGGTTLTVGKNQK